MSTSLFSLIFAGVVGVGTFAGTLQQNLSHPQAPEIDRLFHEIEKLIRDFSRDNPITKAENKYIKETTNTVFSNSRKKRSTDNNEEKKPENTLNVWTDLWVNLINNYVKCLYQICKKDEPKIFTSDDKNKAIETANNANSSEIEKFKQKLTSVKEKIESIYKKIKTFVLKIEFPENYQYNGNDHYLGPYENYVEKISKNNK